MDEAGNRIVIRKSSPAFSREQKLGFSLVVGIGSLAVLIGIFYIGSHVSRAFDIEYDGPPVLSLEQRQEQALLDLKSRDTDGDGLSDYDELYIYRTSPYLADTDGDGLTDAEEIAMGSDPNCNGNNCAGSADQFGSGSAVDVDFDIPGADVASENLGIINELISGVTPELVRGFLIESGVNEDVVNGYSDDEIMDIYQSVITDLEGTGELEELLAEDAARASGQ